MALVTTIPAAAHAPGVSVTDVPDSPAETTWREALPVLTGRRVQLRDLRPDDAASLQRALNTDAVTRFISPPPTTVAGFRRFIEWTRTRREAGEYVCFAVVPAETDDAVGIIQVRQLGGSFDAAEWGFAIAERFWGTGLFLEAARLVLGFCFDTIGVRRLEARAAAENGRGNGVLRKLGASCEGRLKHSLRCNGRSLDQLLWAVSRNTWDVAVHQ